MRNKTISKWYFFLTSLILGLLIVLIVSSANWVNGSFLARRTGQISVQPTFTELAPGQWEFFAAATQPVLQQAAFREQTLTQQSQILETRNTLSMELERDLHRTILFNLRVGAVSGGLALIIGSIFGGMGLNRYLARKAQAGAIASSSSKVVVKVTASSGKESSHQGDKIIIDSNGDRPATWTDIQNSTPLWSSKDGFISPNNYPRAG